MRDRERVLDRNLRHHDKPELALTDEIDEAKTKRRELLHQRVRVGNQPLMRKNANNLARAVLHGRRSLLERDLKAGFCSFDRKTAAVALAVGAVDFHFEVATTLVFDLDSLEAERSGARLQLLRLRKRREMPEDRPVVHANSLPRTKWWSRPCARRPLRRTQRS